MARWASCCVINIKAPADAQTVKLREETETEEGGKLYDIRWEKWDIGIQSANTQTIM